MLTIRSRGRPRLVKSLDRGTPELQLKRQKLSQYLPSLATTPEYLAALEGSRLHVFYLQGWISREMLQASLWYGFILYRYYQSQGIYVRLRCSLKDPRLKGFSLMTDDQKAVEIWHKITRVFDGKQKHLLDMLVMMGPAPWPDRQHVMDVMVKLLSLYQNENRL